ncbi:putative transcription factor B3-Domain family [Helianthus anomalus]
MTQSMVMMLMIFLLRPNIRRGIVVLELSFKKVLLWNVKTTNFSWQVLNLCSMILMIPSLKTFFSSQLEMEELKKKFKDDWDRKTEPQGKASVVCDEDLTIKDKSKFEMDLDQFLIPKNKSHVDPTGKTIFLFSEPTLCSTVVSDAIPKYTIDVGQTVFPRKRKATRKCKTDMIVSDEYLVAHRTRSKFRNKNESVVVDKITPTETTSVTRKRSTLKRSKSVSIIEFTKVAENRLRLPSAVSDELSLSVHNLRDVLIQNLRCEVINMKTIAEKNGGGYRYGFSKWLAFLKSNQIHIGATLFFKYVKSSQLLILTKVVHKTTKKRGLIYFKMSFILSKLCYAGMEDQGEIIFLNDIDALSTNYTIKVKIISLWRKKMKGNERETYRIDMILMDEMGTKIQASCLHRLFSKFERHLNVDECLIIKRPSLAANTASFKIVPNNQKLSFYYHTFVEKMFSQCRGK